MTDTTYELPTIEDLYPYEVTVKHKDEATKVGLAVVKHLEANNIMNNVHFILELHSDSEKVGLRFRKKKYAKWFKARKKDIRDAALQSN